MKKIDVLNLFQSSKSNEIENVDAKVHHSIEDGNVNIEGPSKKGRRGITITDEADRNKWIGVPLVIPGKIMVVYKKNRRFHATWGDYRMQPLQDIRRVHYEALEHHFLNSHLDALRYVLTCISAYMHTYIHTYIQAHVCILIRTLNINP